MSVVILVLFALLVVEQEGVDVRHEASRRDQHRAHHLCQLFVVTYGKLQMSRRNGLTALLVCRLASKFKYFCHDVFQDCSYEDGASLSDAVREAALS